MIRDWGKYDPETLEDMNVIVSEECNLFLSSINLHLMSTFMSSSYVYILCLHLMSTSMSSSHIYLHVFYVFNDQIVTHGITLRLVGIRVY